MYRKTGDSAIAAGVYHSVCRCRTELTVRKGDRFPECSRCRHEVSWVFTRSVYQQPPQPPTGNGKAPSEGPNPGSRPPVA
jgi:hypothetical protein